VAFLPQFLSPHSSFPAQMIIFETTFLVLAFAKCIRIRADCVASACARAELTSHQHIQ
jgi:threonine/homoserine/homoserine lactone efflux protein